jgi:ribosomal protein L7/L12
MPQLFNCPSCAVSLEIEGPVGPVVRCAYCGSMVIIPPELRQALADAVPSPTLPQTAKPSQPRLDPAQAVAEIERLARLGRPISAIKLYRETFAVGLKEAKEAVETAAAGEPLPIPIIGGRTNDDEAAAEIARLTAVGSQKEAVKLYRAAFDSSQAEAERAVAHLADGQPLDKARRLAREDARDSQVKLKPGQEPERRSTWLAVLVLLFLLLLACAAIPLLLW